MTKELSTAQQNLLKLPARCFGVVLGNPIGKRISILHAGAAGYYHHPERSEMRNMTSEELSSEVDRMNAEDGVTKAQRHAMEHGSIFGWDCGGADPDNELNRLLAEQGAKT